MRRRVAGLAAVFALASLGPLALFTFSAAAQPRSLVLITSATLGLASSAGVVLLTASLNACYRAERAIAESDARFEQLVDALPTNAEGQRANGEVVSLPPHITHDPTPTGTERTVLFIADNASSIKLLERVFEHRPNIRMLAAQQGSLGLDLARLHYPDLILLDLNLPDTNGINVLAQLHEEPETAKIPVVVMSADSTPGQIKRLLDAGARAYLTKPIDVPQCLALLDSVFAGSMTA